MATTYIRIATKTQFLDTFLKKRLMAEGCIVEKSRGGDELVENVRDNRTSLVIVQKEIGEPDGISVCRAIKGNDASKNIPVIVISSGDDSAEAAAAGADAFLQLPLDEASMVDAVLRLLKKKKTVLLVDDSKVIHTRTGACLRENGFFVLDAYNGVEGLEVARREKPDLIISDVEMPEMDGFSFCREVKQDRNISGIPFIIVSSLGKGLEIERGFEVGANDYLVKPVVHDELISCVNVWLKTIEVRRRETIVVVDDSETITNMLSFGLMQQGFNVIACNDGETAYETIISCMPDAVIADLDMPKLNGFQLIKYMKEKPDTRNIPVVIISSRESRSEAARILKVGAASFVTKPFTIERVLINVERLSAENRMMREREAMKMFLSEAAQEHVFESGSKGGFDSCNLHATERNLVIFFSDIVGFTTMCEKLKPTDVVSLLNDYLDRMTTILKSHGAIIDKYVGDAILALFGGSQSELNPYLSAVKAAKESLDQLPDFNKNSIAEVKVRIGINSGLVVFGEIGSRHYRRDFTVIGDNVNTAQRLQTAADPDGILISDGVYSNVKDFVDATEVGLISVKGKKIGVKAYSVKSVKSC